MRLSLKRSRKTREACVFGIAIICCASLSGGCGRGTEQGTGAASSAPAPEAQDVAAADWPSYNRTLAGDRFSPLDEINRGNVAQLRVECTYTLPEVAAMQAGPIVVDGTMYFTTERNSYSIDAATCAEKWRVERQSSRPSPLGVQRGFAYLDGRLFRGTSDAHVLALDAADGRTLWDVAMDVSDTPGVSMPMAPIAANGMVFIGNAGGDQTGVTGHVYALDAQDGRVVWRFDVVPDDPAVRATWPHADRYPITGGAFWTSFALDTERGVLYVPAGNPAPDFDVEARGGDNLYTNSLIALDAATGRLLGYNQLVKRDEHDWDVNSPPALGVTRAGRQIVASANKDGLLSVLDRGALTSAPPPAGAELGTRLPTIFQSATTTRENVDVPLSRTAPVRFCPGIQGGNEWNGAAFHPQLNMLYTGAVDWCANVQLAQEVTVPSAGAIWFGSAIGEIQGPASEAKGWITAFDADTGAVRWKFAAPAPVVAGVTPTAGGLVFTADLTGHLRAFDAESGAVLFELETGQSIGGGIVSYSAAGKQRIGVASGMKSGIWPGAATESRIQVLGLPAQSASASTACGRECLTELAKSYLAAVVAGNPSAVPLAADIAFVENVTRMQPGEGLWANAASGPTDFAIYVPDTEQQQVGFLGVMEREGEQGDQPVLVAVRLKLEDGAIAEAEHLIAGVNANNMQRLETPRPGLLGEVPAGSRQDYDDLVRIGLSYYDALDDNDGSLMPFADDCQRHENGMVTAGPEAGPGPNADPNRAPVARLCGPQLDSQSFVYIDRIENRRLIAADPVTGLAMGFSHFRHPFDNLPYEVTHTDGSKSQRNKENMPYDPFDMPAAHIFKVGADGLVHEIEAVGFVAPYNSPTGWE